MHFMNEFAESSAHWNTNENNKTYLSEFFFQHLLTGSGISFLIIPKTFQFQTKIFLKLIALTIFTVSK